MTMGRIIKGAKERLVVKTVLGVVVPKRSVDEQLAINVCVRSLSVLNLFIYADD